MNIQNNTLPIGFFDSGVGGLSVLARFRKELPNENVIYFGDTIHLPYGNKSKEELIGYAKNILDFMMKKQVKAVVIACNTSSAQAYDTIKDIYPFKIYPIIQTCAKAIAVNNYKRIGIFATEATIKSGKYTQELKKYNLNIQVKEMASKNWVGIVEKKSKNLEADILHIKDEINNMMEFKPDKIILGCTHYPYLMNEFIKYAPKEIFLDPAEIFIKYVKYDLETKDLLYNPSSSYSPAMDKSGLINNSLGRDEFYVSSNPQEFVQNAKIFYEIKEMPMIIN